MVNKVNSKYVRSPRSSAHPKSTMLVIAGKVFGSITAKIKLKRQFTISSFSVPREVHLIVSNRWTESGLVDQRSSYVNHDGDQREGLSAFS